MASPSAADTDVSSRDEINIRFLLLLSLYFIIHIILRVFISDSMDYDEAEQALLSQWLLAGYTEQPPLYTWIQHLLIQVFGQNVFSISLLKNALLWGTYLFTYLAGRLILQNDKKAVMAACSLLFIPQIAWESQRDMTHTTLVVFAAAATLFFVFSILEKGSPARYVLLGISIGVGLLAKPNFALFLFILLCSLLLTSEGRSLLFKRYFVLSLAVACTMNISYWLWMYNNLDIVFSVEHKFKRALGTYYIIGPASLILNSFLFLSPLWVFLLVLFPGTLSSPRTYPRRLGTRLMILYMVIGFFSILSVVLLFKVTYVKDRWLQPILFAAPLFFFSIRDEQAIHEKRYRIFMKSACGFALLVIVAFSIRTFGASYIHLFCRLNYPFATYAETFKQRNQSEALIISDNRFVAGNMLFALPGSTAIVPGYHFETLPLKKEYSTALILWKGDDNHPIPKPLQDFLQERYELQAGKYPVEYIEEKYKYARDETVTLAVLTVPMSHLIQQ